MSSPVRQSQCVLVGKQWQQPLNQQSFVRQIMQRREAERNLQVTWPRMAKEFCVFWLLTLRDLRKTERKMVGKKRFFRLEPKESRRGRKMMMMIMLVAVVVVLSKKQSKEGKSRVRIGWFIE